MGGLSQALERSVRFLPFVCCESVRSSARRSESNAHSVLDPTMMGPNGMAYFPACSEPRMRVPSSRSRVTENFPGAILFHGTL